MILYRDAYVASQAAAGTPLTNARIGYQTYVRDRTPSDVSASSDSTTAPKDAPLRPDTMEYWQPTAMPATWQVDLGTARTVDYVGLAGHTFGSKGCVVRVQFDSDSTIPDPHLSLSGAAGNNGSAPDSAAVSVVGDVEGRVRVAASDYTPAADQSMYAKWNTTGNQRSFDLRLTTGGLLQLLTSPNGTTVRTHNSSVAVGLTDASSKCFKFTRSAATGVVKFFMSDDDITYAQLGADVAGTIEGIFDSTALLEVGANSSGTANNFVGKVYRAELRNGIAGAVVSTFDASLAVDGAASFQAGTGETWTRATSGVPGSRFNNNIFSTGSAGFIPTNDTPIMMLDNPKVGRYLKITLTGASIPVLAAVYAGQQLAMQKAVSGPYAPITMSRETVLNASMSRGGQFLGQSYRRNGVASSATFKNLTDAWVRANFDAFVQSARRFPYFFAWNPVTFPTEVGYVWTERDIVPAYSGLIDLMNASWDMRGVGSAA